MMKRNFMPMKLQFFGEGDGEVGASTVAGLDGLLDSMSAQTTETQPNTGTEPTQTQSTQTEPTQIPNQTDDTQPQNQNPVPDKANQAFAHMRTQNAKLENLLTKIAQATGIEYSNIDDLAVKLSDDALSKLATKQNVPLELLQKIEALEQTDKLFKQEQLRTTALNGFQNLTTDFGLSQEELVAFAKELDANNMNPFEKPVDLKATYASMHLDDIIAKKTQAAVEAALRGNSAANNQSTKPNPLQGQGGVTTEPTVTTVAGLNALLDQSK